MLPKPPECQGCPLFGDGLGFVPDEVVEEAEVHLVLQNPGENEEKGKKVLDDDSEVDHPPAPVIGKTGRELFRQYAPLAGIQRGTASLGNILKCRAQDHCRDRRGRPARCNHLPTGKVLKQAVEHCTRAHFKVSPKAKLLVASGALAWDYLSQGKAGKITDWRGFLAPEPFQDRPVLGTLHVADLFRDPIMKLPSQLDFSKVPKILAGKWPKPIPPYIVATEEEAGRVEDWFQAAAKAPFVVLDTEYDADSKYLFLIGLRANGVEHSLIFDWRVKHEPWFRSRYIGQLRSLLRMVPTVFQNALADLPVLEQNVGIKLDHYYQIEDTLLAHALLWTEHPHDLEFLASIYGSYPKLKHLAKENLYLYLQGDLIDTEAVWLALEKEFKGDPRSYHIYRTRSIPLVPILVKATRKGVRIDREKAKEILKALQAVCDEANLLGKAWCGRPINVGSTHQVKKRLLAEGVKVKNCEADTIYAALLKHPDNELLRARRKYSEADGFRKYIRPMTKVDEAHPEFLPTQSTGRVSVKKPPLVNFPDDGKAKKRGLPPVSSIFLPFPGEWWLCFDYSAMHARFMAAACGDHEDLEAFKKGYDLHTITACRSLRMPLPPNLYSADHPDNKGWRQTHAWMEKDRRRHLFKTVRYSLLNGINHKAVREAKEVAEQGLDLDELERFGIAFLAAKPQMVAWKRSYCAEALRVGHARSLYGRKRLLIPTGPEEKAQEERMKAAISGFLQMTEVDIMTETLIECCRRYPEATLVFPSHDGIKLAFPDSYDPKAVYLDLRPFVEREHDFWGQKIDMPAEWLVLYADGRKEALK